MENVYYLVHITNESTCRSWDELKIASFNTDDQFPGVYLSIITKFNIMNESLFPGKYIMIFSKKLLLQKNYHVNNRDYNGILTETHTYYPWNIDMFINEGEKFSNKKTENEIVFHDNISTKYLYKIIERSTDMHSNKILPIEEIETYAEPNMDLIPFYCYPFDDMYTGIDPLPRSSNEWYKIIMKMCNIEYDKNDTIEIMLQKIREKSIELYNDRSKQNISYLEKYVMSLKNI
jgi:hypothetical protein